MSDDIEEAEESYPGQEANVLAAALEHKKARLNPWDEGWNGSPEEAKAKTLNTRKLHVVSAGETPEPEAFIWTVDQVREFREHLRTDPSQKNKDDLAKLIGKKLAEAHADELILAAEAESDPLVLVPEADVLARPEPEWWIESLIQKGTVAVFAGEAGIGKTFMAIHMTRCVATGTPFFHRTVSKGSVLYVAAEGASAFGARIRAWDDYHAKTPAPGQVNYLESGVNLSDPESVSRLCDLLDTLQPDLIILDTLSQLGGITDENAAGPMSEVFRTAKRLRDRKAGSSVILVHHVNKGAGAVRGSSVIRSNADTVVVAKAGKGDDFYLTTDIGADGKQKDGSPVKIEGFHLIDHGRSAVVVMTAPDPDPDLDSLRDVFADGAAHSKVEAQHAAGHPKANSKDAAYMKWNRKWTKWTAKATAILVPDATDPKLWRLLEIAR